MAAVSARLGKLERLTCYHRYSPEDCPGPVTAIAEVGDPPPADAVPCRLCGTAHVAWLEIVVIDPATDGRPDGGRQ